MFCSNCLSEQGNTAFCPGCGNKLENKLMPAKMITEQEQKEKDQYSLVVWGWCVATIGTFIIPIFALVGVVLGIILLTKPGKIGHGIGVLLTSILVFFLSFSFWSALFNR